MVFRPSACWPLALFALAACETYSPAPVDLAEHLRRFADRTPAAAASSTAPGHFDPTDGLDRREAQLVALVFNPELRTLRLQAGVASAVAATAGRWPDPELDASFLRILDSAVQYPWLASASLGLTLPLTGRPALEQELAVGRRERAFTAARVAEASLLDRVDAAWIAWSAAREHAALLGELVASLERLEATAARLAAMQTITQTEARTFTLARLARTAELAQARGDGTLRELDLKRLLGLPPERAIAFVPSLARPARAPAAAERRDRLLASPAVAVARADHDVAEKKLQLAVRKQWPDLTLQPRWEEEDAEPRLGLGFTLPLPLWNGNAQEIAEARAERTASAELLRAAVETCVQDLARAETRLAMAQQQRQLVDEQLLPLARQQIADVQRLQDLGQLDTLLLLDALTRSFDARTAAVRAAAAEADAAIALDSLFWPELSSPRQEP